MTYTEILTKIFELLPNATDCIPLDFKFTDNIATVVKLNDIEDMHYKDDVELRVQVSSNRNNRLKALEEIDRIDKLLNNYQYDFWITHQTTYRVEYENEDILTTYLYYNISNYNR